MHFRDLRTHAHALHCGGRGQRLREMAPGNFDPDPESFRTGGPVEAVSIARFVTPGGASEVARTSSRGDANGLI